MYEKKRKTKTSSAVKNRYNSKVYDSIIVRVPKDMASAFKEKCAAEGVPQARIIKKAIEDFLKNTDENKTESEPQQSSFSENVAVRKT